MKKIRITISVFLVGFVFLFSSYTFSQQQTSSFIISDPRKKSVSLKFQFLNNIIVLPMKINGDTSLNFILDSGVESTLVTNISYKDSIHFNSRVLKRFYGLGENEYLEAYKTSNNLLELKEIKSENQFFYAIPMEVFDFSKIFKVKVQGVIGYDLFKDFIVEIDYLNKRIVFHDPAKYTPSRRKLKKYTKLPLEFEQSKPFIRAFITLADGKKIPVKLLIDTGGSFAAWFSEDSHQEIKAPKNASMAYLGETLNGEFYGLQGEISQIDIGKYQLKQPVVAFPDSNAVSFIYRTDGRNGSIGTDILRRFHLIFDYANKALWVKPNAQFNSPYNFNKSGLELMSVSNGLFFKVTFVDASSPAYKAGIRADDIVLKINSKFVKEYELHEVYDLFRKSAGRSVKFQIFSEDKLPIKKISVFFPNKATLKVSKVQ